MFQVTHRILRVAQVTRPQHAALSTLLFNNALKASTSAASTSSSTSSTILSRTTFDHATISPANTFTMARRTMFIRTQETPNPLSLKFLPGKTVLTEGSADFSNFRNAQKSPLARRLFKIEGVNSVFLGQDFITVNIMDTAEWPVVKPDVFSAIQEFYASNEPALTELPTASDTAILPEDDDTVAMIKELIETRIRPTVQEDGGDIVYRGFSADGIVSLEMQGSCKGCPSSSVTLKNGIENMLMHYVPEVKGVKEYIDEDVAEASRQQLEKLEKEIAKKNSS